jgi:hypothetical protein
MAWQWEDGDETSRIDHEESVMKRMSRRNTVAVAVVSLVALWTLPPESIAFSATVADATAVVSVSIGDVVARGIPNGTGACSFAGVNAVPLEAGHWLALQVGDDCAVRVSDQWSGSLADGPSRFASLATSIDASDVPAASPPTGDSLTECLTVKQHFFTYGFGGAAFDKLTHVWSSMTYCFNGTKVWGTTTQGSACAGTPEISWSWVVDSCVYASQQLAASTSSVWSTVRGNFHCSPATGLPCSLSNGYYHRLFDQVTAYPSGRSHCSNWWDGQIVLGPESEIISGCV